MVADGLNIRFSDFNQLTLISRFERKIILSEKKMTRAERFNDIINGLNSKYTSEYGGGIISRSGEVQDVETISSGSLVLDSLLGGGIAKGRIVSIEGPEGSGKSSIALTVAGNVQKEGGNVLYVDAEYALDPKYAQVLGVNMEDLAIAQPDHLEQAFNLMMDIIPTGVIDLIVVDSTSSLQPEQEFSGDMSQQTMALQARALSKGFKKLVPIASRFGTTIIFINQIRDTMAMYGPKTTITGGRAQKFYASQMIEVRRQEVITEGKDAIGTQVALNIKKNKIAPPYRRGETVLTFAKGVNKYAEILTDQVGVKYGLIQKRGSWYYNAITGEGLAQGMAKTMVYLEENPEIYEQISTALKKCISADKTYQELVEEGEVEPETAEASKPAKKTRTRKTAKKAEDVEIADSDSDDAESEEK